MRTEAKPTLLLYGATGITGRYVMQGLIKSDAFKLVIITRAAGNPHVQQWKLQGVEEKVIDVGAASHIDLVRLLKGVDIIVSLVAAFALETQVPLFAAAKDAGVKRVVPSDFGPSYPPGRLYIGDRKYAIREYVKALGLPYTFIEIGWWMDFSIPRPPSVPGPDFAKAWQVYGEGNVPLALTSVERIADLLALIVVDDRTLRNTVFCWEEEVTQTDMWKIVDLSSEAEDIKKRRTTVPAETLKTMAEGAVQAYSLDPSITTLGQVIYLQYMLSLYVHGDNTAAKAKVLGALDARELYPNLRVQTLAQYAREWYKNPQGNPYF